MRIRNRQPKQMKNTYTRFIFVRNFQCNGIYSTLVQLSWFISGLLFWSPYVNFQHWTQHLKPTLYKTSRTIKNNYQRNSSFLLKKNWEFFYFNLKFQNRSWNLNNKYSLQRFRFNWVSLGEISCKILKALKTSNNQ